ncbi:MAG: AMP-binding protein [Tetrasphaera sp.]
MQTWGIERIEDLHTRAIDDPEWFWRAVVDDLDVTFTRPFTRVIDETDGKPFPRWFVDGGINAATLCALRYGNGPLADKEAVVYEGDDGTREVLTYRDLDEQVRSVAAALTDLGIGRGDRVVLFVPVSTEATVAFLACAMIGAVLVPAFTGFSVDALASRIVDSEAVAVITADATTRRGKPVPLKATLDDALEQTDTVRAVIVVRRLGTAVTMRAGRDVYWNDLETNLPEAIVEEMDPNDPLAIVYTSGTTGRPKGIVHSHAGLSLKAAFDFGYTFDVQEDDTVGWISDMGWLVGPLMILSCLQLGATMVLIEGTPTYPDASRMWQLIDRNRITLMGIAPTAARAIMAERPERPDGLDSLRAFASTGEAWDEPTWSWLFHEVGQGTRPIINYSGGTEVGGGILTSYPFLPIGAASFNGPVIGMDAAVVDPDGHPVMGEVGELTLLNMVPGMTHAFWQDRERYLDTYWSRWDGVWLHGDLASVDDTGAWRIHGRSDDTIKVSGRRVGPAEIEAGILKDPRIVEAAAIGIPDEARGQRIVAFVATNDPSADPAALTAAALTNVGKSFAPELIVVRTLPKTKNGKIMRRAIRARHLGTAAGDMSSLDPATPLEDIPVQHTPDIRTEQGEQR